MLIQVDGKFVDGHPVNTRATLVVLYPLQCCLQIFSLADFLHESKRSSWAFGVTPRPKWLERLPSRLPGFTRILGVEVRLRPNILPSVTSEVHVLLATSLVRAFSGRRGTRPLRPLLTSAVRSGHLSMASVATRRQTADLPG